MVLGPTVTLKADTYMRTVHGYIIASMTRDILVIFDLWKGLDMMNLSFNHRA